ncbi:MAG: hypothetical protein ACXACI_05850 [Candidatus Hodarchaeales archaeon]|jgi:hypothetical protein
MQKSADLIPTLVANISTPIPIPSFPIALRWGIFLPLFGIVILLEGIIMALFLRPRLRIAALVFLANIITSCLLIPAFAFHMGWSWGDFPLMLPAFNVWNASQQGDMLWSAFLLSFVLMMFLYGIPTIVIEGAIIRYFTEGTSKREWSVIALGNVVSYLFLTLWSSYVGIQMKDMNSEEASDYVFKHILARPSEGEFSALKFLGWSLFALVLLLCFSIMLYGNKLHKMPTEEKLLAYSMKANNIALNMGMIHFFVFSLSKFLIEFAIILYIFLGLVFLATTVSDWSDTWPQQEPQMTTKHLD